MIHSQSITYPYGELPHQKYKQKSIDALYKNLNEIILIIT